MHKHAAANVAQRNRLNGKQQIPVGWVSAKPVNRPILSLNRKPKSRVESALNPIDLTVLAEYHEQIESNLQRIERKNQRTWYSHAVKWGDMCWSPENEIRAANHLFEVIYGQEN